MLNEPANLSLQARFDQLMAAGLRSLGYDPEFADDFRGWQRQLREALSSLLAVHPGEEQEVVAETGDERDMGDYLRRYVRITSRDGVVIPAFLLIPKTLASPAVAVVCLHGHGPGKVVPADFGQDVKGRPLTVEGERDFAVQAVREGHIALAPDLRGFGELMLQDDLDADRGSSCQQLAMRAIMVGRTLLGMRVLDVISCVDYLTALPEVDPAKIVCTGQSGGATVTLFATALDSRFAVSIPSCYFCTFRHSILAMTHCDCNYVPGLLNLCEMYDVAGLIAPRPLLIVSGEHDSIFPLAGVQVAFERVQAMYTAAGAPGNVELYVGPDGHRYYKQRVWDFVRERLG
ncbi:MAG: prolyl oligopeptidase family serine peptidase [Armatimonadetes bacterium]|nr:prolyl oligopeptidase family serine peptidase [Armatimonadota bacterium]